LRSFTQLEVSRLRCGAFTPGWLITHSVSHIRSLRLTLTAYCVMAILVLSPRRPLFRCGTAWLVELEMTPGFAPAIGSVSPWLGLFKRVSGRGSRKSFGVPRASFHLRSLLLDLLPGAGCLPELTETLLDLARDPSRTFSERHDALFLLWEAKRSDVDWPALLTGLCRSGHPDAARLADEAVAHVGIQHFRDDDLVEIIFAQCGGFDGAARARGFEDFWSLTGAVSVERCANLLDALVHRFGGDEEAGALAKHQAAFGRLVWTLIVRQIPGVPPGARRLWRWLDAFADYYGSEPGSRAVTAAWLAGNAPLRQAVQAQMFLTEEGVHSLQSRHWHIGSMSQGLYFQEDDVVLMLDALTECGQRHPNRREPFETLVRGWSLGCAWTARMAEAAERCARDDPDLLAILHPKKETRRRARSAALEGFAKRQRRAEQQREKRKRADRAAVLKKLDDLRSGRGPASPLALCFLGYGKFGGRDCPIAERIGQWVGEDLALPAYQGFEASLHRPLGMTLHDVTGHLLPRDSEHDAIWPIVAGLAQRHLDGRGFRGLEEDIVLAGNLARRLKMNVVDKHLDRFGDAMDAFVTANGARFERFLRALIEPQLPGTSHYVTGTHYLLGGKDHHSLRTRLLLEWFDLLMPRMGTDQKVLVEALLDAPAALQMEAGQHVDALIAAVPPRWDGEDETSYWTALKLLRDFEASRPALEAAAEDRDFLWELRRVVGHDRFGDRKFRPLPADRLAWIFQRFELRWPDVDRPRGPGSGSRNPWDASEFLQAVLFQIAQDTSPPAMRLLHEMTERGSESYGEALRAARARQRTKATESGYVPQNLEAIAAALRDAAPRVSEDIKAIVIDALVRLQARIAGSATDTIDLFYQGDRPKDEERCRNALLDLLGPILPFGITWAPEERMPDGKRADAGFRSGEIRVPLEAKLDCNATLWTAPNDQLDRLYASSDYMAAGQGIYLVFWFGKAGSGRRPVPRPRHGQAPGSAQELEAMLRKHLTGGAGSRLAIIVLDLERKIEVSPK